MQSKYIPFILSFYKEKVFSISIIKKKQYERYIIRLTTYQYIKRNGVLIYLILIDESDRSQLLYDSFIDHVNVIH